MKSYRLVFSPEARAQLTELYRFIAAEASPAIATRYTDNIVSLCESLGSLPFRGTRRDDIRPGLRTISYRKRAAILFSVEDETVAIIGIFYGGQNWEDRFVD